MRGRLHTLSSASAWWSVSTLSFLQVDGSERDALDSASTPRGQASALSTRQLVARILRDNRHGATVFPKQNFGVTTWTDWSAWRCSSKPLTPAVLLLRRGISASRRKWPGITCADWRRIWGCAC